MKARLRFSRYLLAAAVAASFVPFSAYAKGAREKITDTARVVSSLRPPQENLTGAIVFRRLLEHDHIRDSDLNKYSATKTYELSNPSRKVYVREVVLVRYRAPEKKLFRTESQSVSWLVRHLVFNRLIAAKRRISSGKEHHDSSITPCNCRFTLLGEQNVSPYQCFVIRVTPHRRGKYLFDSTMWISSQDFAIVRIAGHPARKLSFWIKRADFVRTKQKFGRSWLPVLDETVVKVRFSGTKILSIRQICEVAPKGATVGGESKTVSRVFEYYFRRFGREDLRYADIINDMKPSSRSDPYFVISPGGEYKENSLFIRKIEADTRPVWRIAVRDIPAARIYHTREMAQLGANR